MGDILFLNGKQMNSITTSILIAIRNGETTLDRCLESLHAQTYQQFRIICVNDASQDTTKSILQKWQNVFGTERFIIIEKNKNIGLTRSLNSGLEKIDTSYTARIDADDWWIPEKLEKQVHFLDTHQPYGIIGCAYINISYGKKKPIILPETDSDLKKLMFYRNPFAHSCVLFRTDLIKNVGGYDNSIYYGQDYELWLRISNQTKFYNLPEILCYRNADSGISHSKQNAQMWQYIKTQYKYLRKLRRPLSDYCFIIEPMIVVLTPQWIRTLKRKYL